MPGKTNGINISNIPHVRRIENFDLMGMRNAVLEMQKPSYTHDEVYGTYCTIEDYINCPPQYVFDYLKDQANIEEWTYSLRDMVPANEPGRVVFTDRIGGTTKCFFKTVSNAEAMTVDYHCAWDQGEHLWMIYLMRVVSASLVLNRPGSVVLWTNVRHPFYDNNPHPEKAPQGRPVWVGDLWPMFYAGHSIEMKNLKYILEHRYRNEAGAERE